MLGRGPTPWHLIAPIRESCLMCPATFTIREDGRELVTTGRQRVKVWGTYNAKQRTFDASAPVADRIVALHSSVVDTLQARGCEFVRVRLGNESRRIPLRTFLAQGKRLTAPDPRSSRWLLDLSRIGAFATEGDEDMRKLLSTAEMAEMLEVHIGTLQRYAREGVVKPVRINSRVWKWDPDEVFAALDKRSRALGGSPWRQETDVPEPKKARKKR